MSDETPIIVGRQPTPPPLVEIADGMVASVACALYAAGADVFVPDAEYLDELPYLWPEEIDGASGRYLVRSGIPPESARTIAPVVAVGLDYGENGYRFRGMVCLPGEGRRHVSAAGKPLVILRALANLLQLAGHELLLSVPHDFTWREIAGGETARAAWKMLEIFGAQSQAAAVSAPAANVRH